MNQVIEEANAQKFANACWFQPTFLSMSGRNGVVHDSALAPIDEGLAYR